MTAATHLVSFLQIVILNVHLMLKNLFISALFFMFSASICAQKTYVPDDNFENRLIYFGYDDVLDDSVLTANISGITELKVGAKHIADLTGIEDFISLTYLDCFGNNLTSIDVSKNIHLKTLRCNNNQLTSLDISNNSVITYLECFSNQLSELDITNNSLLLELKCEANKLINLDLSNNSHLIKINCYSNQLTNLDVSNNIALTEIKCFSNQITNLDLSKNIALTSLECTYNQIVNLDVSNNTALTYLRCIGNQLESLNVKNGNNALMTYVNATDNPSLFCIEVDDAAKANKNTVPYTTSKWKIDAVAHYSNDCRNSTYITDENFENALISLGYDDIVDMNVLTANISGITTLNLFKKSIRDMTGIQDFTSLEELACGYNSLTTIDVSQNTALKVLRCWDNQITSLDISNNTTLIELRFDHNQITNIDISMLTKLIDLGGSNNLLTTIDLSANPKLETVYIPNNQVENIDISNNPALKRLLIYNNHLTQLDVDLNTKLWDIHCEGNQLTELDVSNNDSLSSIVCSDNQLTDLDLSANPLLTRIECNQNQLVNLNVKNGTNSLVTIFKANDNPLLQCIEVDNATAANAGEAPYDVWVKDAEANYSETCEGITAINDTNFEQALIDLGIVAENSVDGRVSTDEIASITQLDLSGMSISDLTGIADFTALETLILNDNQITYLDLANNPNLVTVDISNNPIVTLLVTDSDIIKTAFLTKNNNTTNENLLSIDISNTDIASIDLSNVPNLETFIAFSSMLTSLDVSNNANLTEMNLTNCTLGCIQVSQIQFDNIPAGWQKEDEASYSVECDTATDINNNKTSVGIILHPNPVSGILYIESDILITKIEFYSVTGEQIKIVISDFDTINLSSLRKGLYLVQIFTVDGVAVKKLMKN